MKFPVGIQLGKALFIRNGFDYVEQRNLYQNQMIFQEFTSNFCNFLGSKLFRSVSGKNFKVHWILKANDKQPKDFERKKFPPLSLSSFKKVQLQQIKPAAFPIRIPRSSIVFDRNYISLANNFFFSCWHDQMTTEYSVFFNFTVGILVGKQKKC